jgi:hypothetical protein
MCVRNLVTCIHQRSVNATSNQIISGQRNLVLRRSLKSPHKFGPGDRFRRLSIDFFKLRRNAKCANENCV